MSEELYVCKKCGSEDFVLKKKMHRDDYADTEYCEVICKQCDEFCGRAEYLA